MYICDCSPTGADVGVATVFCDSSRNGRNNRRNHICDPLQSGHFNIIKWACDPSQQSQMLRFFLKKIKNEWGNFVDNLNKYIYKHLKYRNI